MSDSLQSPLTVALNASLSIEFSRQDYWSGSLFHTLGDLPNPGVEPESPELAGRFLTAEPRGKPTVFPIFTLFLLFLTPNLWTSLSWIDEMK